MKIKTHRILYTLYTLFALSIMAVSLTAGIAFGGDGADQSPLRIVTDMAGRTVTLEGPVKRIIATFKPATLSVLSLSMQDRLVGVDSSSIKDRLSTAVFPEIVNIKGVGSKTMGLNYETIISLKPDLVILYAQKDGIELAGQLEKMGIPSIIIFPENFQSIKASLRLIARAADDMKAIEKVEAAIDSVLEMVEKRVSFIPEGKKKSAYFASSQGIYNTASGNMHQDDMFKRAGLLNVSHDLKGYFQNISLEQLLRWNPDMIIVSQHMKSRNLNNLDRSALKDIGAVKSQQIFRSPSSLAPWDFPLPLSALGVLWLADKAYPDLFKDVDVSSVINTFHVTLFNKSLDQMGGRLDDGIDATR